MNKEILKAAGYLCDEKTKVYSKDFDPIKDKIFDRYICIKEVENGQYILSFETKEIKNRTAIYKEPYMPSIDINSIEELTQIIDRFVKSYHDQ